MAEASIISYVYVIISGLILAIILVKLKKTHLNFTFNNKIRKIMGMKFIKKNPVMAKILDGFAEYYPLSIPIAIILTLLGLSQSVASFDPTHPFANYIFRIGLLIALWGFALGLTTTIQYNMKLKKLEKKVLDLQNGIIKQKVQKIESVVNSNTSIKIIIIASVLSGIIGAGITGFPLYQQLDNLEVQVIESKKTTQILNQTLQVAEKSLDITKQTLEKEAEIFIHIDPISPQAEFHKALTLITQEKIEIKATKFIKGEVIFIENTTVEFDIYISNIGNAVAFIDSYSVSIINNAHDPPFGHSDLGNKIKKILKPDGDEIKVHHNVTVTEGMSPFGEIEVFVTYNNNERADADRLLYHYGIINEDEILEVRTPKNSPAADTIK